MSVRVGRYGSLAWYYEALPSGAIWSIRVGRYGPSEWDDTVHPSGEVEIIVGEWNAYTALIPSGRHRCVVVRRSVYDFRHMYAPFRPPTLQRAESFSHRIVRASSRTRSPPPPEPEATDLKSSRLTSANAAFPAIAAPTSGAR